MSQPTEQDHFCENLPDPRYPLGKAQVQLSTVLGSLFAKSWIRSAQPDGSDLAANQPESNSRAHADSQVIN